MRLVSALFCLLFLAPIVGKGQKGVFPPFDIPYFSLYAHPKFSRTMWHTGVGVGIYSGDLAAPFHVGRQGGFLNPQLNAGIAYQLTHFVAFRAEGAWFRLRATPGEGLWGGTGFKGNYWEASVSLVHRIFPKYYFESIYRGFDPYVFVGIGLMRYSTKPIGTLTEESGRAQGTSRVIPLGVGFNYQLRGNIWLSLEAGYRLTQTDLLDNASVAEDPNPKNDGYYLYRIVLTVQPRKHFWYPHFLKRMRLRRR